MSSRVSRGGRERTIPALISYLGFRVGKVFVVSGGVTCVVVVDDAGAVDSAAVAYPRRLNVS